jgi:Tfp pilus assembly protein PilF
MDTEKKQAGKQHIKEAYRALFANDFARAVCAFEKAIQCDPTNASYYFKLSITCARNQQLDLAIQTIEKALVLEPKNEKFIMQHQRLNCRRYTEEAVQCLEKGSIEQALVLIERAVELDPLYMQAHYVAAQVYFLRGQYIQARKAARQAVRLAPNFLEARVLLARCREQVLLEKKRRRGRHNNGKNSCGSSRPTRSNGLGSGKNDKQGRNVAIRLRH